MLMSAVKAILRPALLATLLVVPFSPIRGDEAIPKFRDAKLNRMLNDFANDIADFAKQCAALKEALNEHKLTKHQRGNQIRALEAQWEKRSLSRSFQIEVYETYSARRKLNESELNSLEEFLSREMKIALNALKSADYILD